MALVRKTSLAEDKFRNIITCIKVVSTTDEKKKVEEAFNLIRENLYGVTPEDINKTRYHVEGVGMISVCEALIYVFHQQMNRRSFQVESLLNLMDLFFKMGILETNKLEKLVEAGINPLAKFPHPLIRMVTEYAYEEEKEFEEGVRADDRLQATRKKVAQERLKERSPLLHQLVDGRLYSEPVAIENVKKALARFYKAGADLNIRGPHNTTALHVSAAARNYELMFELHNLGCGFNIISGDNHTALDIVVANEQVKKEELTSRFILDLKAMGAKSAKDLVSYDYRDQRYYYSRRTNMFVNSEGAIDATKSDSELLTNAYLESIETLAEKFKAFNSHTALYTTDKNRKTIVDILIERAEKDAKVAIEIFSNDAIRITIQSTFSLQDIRRCLDVYNNAVKVKEKKDREANMDVSDDPVKEADVGSVSAMPSSPKSPTLFAKDKLSPFKLICAMPFKQEEKFTAAIKAMNVNPDRFASLIKAVSGQMEGAKLFNKFIELLGKYKKANPDAVNLSAEEIEAFKKADAAPAKTAKR